MGARREGRRVGYGEAMADSLRFEIRVKPGAKGHGVGGTHGDDGPLNVSVQQKAVDGAANKGVVRLLATVLQVRPRQLRIVSGHTHRTKLVELTDPPAGTAERLDFWRNKS